MPRPKRKARRAGGQIPDHIKALFDVGCGHTAIGDDEARRLWKAHGGEHLRSHHGSWGLMYWGQPEEIRE